MAGSSTSDEAELLRQSQQALDKACSLFEEYVQSARTVTGEKKTELEKAKGEAENARKNLQEFQGKVREWKEEKKRREENLKVLYGKVDDLKEETRGERLRFEQLQETFQSQKRRALRLDGHFQVMDDPYSRDKLVKRFHKLYDEADGFCERLEDLCESPEQTERAADKGEEFFKIALLESFKQAKALLQTICSEMAEITGAQQSKEEISLWYRNLVKELLRGNREKEAKSSVPCTIVEFTLKALRKEDSCHFRKVRRIGQTTHLWGLYKKKNPKVNNLMVEFVKKATEICWHLAILPDDVDVEDPVGEQFREEFHQQHARSDINSHHVQRCLWPGLANLHHGQPKTCLLKALVLTHEQE